MLNALPLEEYLDITNNIVLHIEADFSISLVNHRGCELLGLPKEKILGKNWLIHFVPTKCQFAFLDMLKSLFAGENEKFKYWESEIQIPDKSMRLIAWRNKVIRNSANQINSVLCSGEDITDARLADKNLQKNLVIQSVLSEFTWLILKKNSLEENLQFILNRLLAVPWLKLENRCAIFLYHKASNKLRLAIHQGFSHPEQIPFPSVNNKSTPEFQSTIIAKPVLSNTITSPKGNLIQYNGQTIFNAPLITVEQELQGFLQLFFQNNHLLDQPKINFISSVAQIMTGLIQHKQATAPLLLLNTENIQQIFESIASILITINQDNFVSRWNPAAERAFGITADAILGKNFSESPIPWEWNETLKNLPHMSLPNKSLKYEHIPYQRPDGSKAFLDLMVTPIRFNDHECSEFLLVGNDNTDG